MRRQSMPWIVLPILSSMLLVAGGAFFGIIAARVLWAEDLQHAQRIDEIRSRTQKALEGTIESLRKQITICERK